MKTIALLLLAVAALFGELGGDPQTAVISTGDVALFWKAFDRWTSEGAKEDQLAPILQGEYLDKGSAGVRDFTPNRIESADALAKKILEDRAYYENVRPYVDRILPLEPEIRKVYRQFSTMYPQAQFPALYFVVGRRNSGGMSSPRALIIGTEMFGSSTARLPFDTMIPMVAHELMHFQQQTTAEKGAGFLPSCLREGAADFLAEMLVGRHINEAIRGYGDQHERELWEKFQQDLRRPDGHRAWLYNGRDPNRKVPPDLGYYMGYRIAKSFWENAPDREAALRAIIEIRDPEAILHSSGYAARLSKAP